MNYQGHVSLTKIVSGNSLLPTLGKSWFKFSVWISCYKSVNCNHGQKWWKWLIGPCIDLTEFYCNWQLQILGITRILKFNIFGNPIFGYIINFIQIISLTDYGSKFFRLFWPYTLRSVLYFPKSSQQTTLHFRSNKRNEKYIPT